MEIKKVDVLSIVPGRGRLSLFKRDKSGNNCLKEGEREKELNERQSGAEPVNLIKSSIFSFEKDLLGKEQRQDKANTNFSRRRKRKCSKIHWSLQGRGVEEMAPAVPSLRQGMIKKKRGICENFKYFFVGNGKAQREHLEGEQCVPNYEGIWQVCPRPVSSLCAMH